MVAEQRKLNPAHYNLTLPAEDPKVKGHNINYASGH